MIPTNEHAKLIAELMALHQPGEWGAFPASTYTNGQRTINEWFVRQMDTEEDICPDVRDGNGKVSKANAEFIAAAHNGIPLLVNYIRQLEAWCVVLEAQVKAAG